MAGHDNIPTLAEQVSRVPTQPGCYLWKDAKGDVIYVGKAKNLRARMRQYVTLQDERQKIPLMMQLVASTIRTLTSISKTIKAIPLSPLPRATCFRLLNTRESVINRERAILALIPIAVRRVRPSIRYAR